MRKLRTSTILTAVALLAVAAQAGGQVTGNAELAPANLSNYVSFRHATCARERCTVSKMSTNSKFAGKTNGTDVWLWDKPTDEASQYVIFPELSGYVNRYLIVSRDSGLAVSRTSRQPSTGHNVHLCSLGTDKQNQAFTNALWSFKQVNGNPPSFFIHPPDYKQLAWNIKGGAPNQQANIQLWSYDKSVTGPNCGGSCGNVWSIKAEERMKYPRIPSDCDPSGSSNEPQQLNQLKLRNFQTASPTPPKCVGATYLPFYAVADNAGDRRWQVQNSPWYLLKVSMQHRVLPDPGSLKTADSSKTYSYNTTEGFSDTDTQSLSTTIGAQYTVGATAGPAVAQATTSLQLSASVTGSLGQSKTRSSSQSKNVDFTVSRCTLFRVWAETLIYTLVRTDGTEVNSWTAQGATEDDSYTYGSGPNCRDDP